MCRVMEDVEGVKNVEGVEDVRRGCVEGGRGC